MVCYMLWLWTLHQINLSLVPHGLVRGRGSLLVHCIIPLIITIVGFIYGINIFHIYGQISDCNLRLSAREVLWRRADNLLPGDISPRTARFLPLVGFCRWDVSAVFFFFIVSLEGVSWTFKYCADCCSSRVFGFWISGTSRILRITGHWDQMSRTRL